MHSVNFLFSALALFTNRCTWHNHHTRKLCGNTYWVAKTTFCPLQCIHPNRKVLSDCIKLTLSLILPLDCHSIRHSHTCAYPLFKPRTSLNKLSSFPLSSASPEGSRTITCAFEDLFFHLAFALVNTRSTSSQQAILIQSGRPYSCSCKVMLG